MHIVVSTEDNLHENQILLSETNKKTNSINLSSSDLAQRVVKVKCARRVLTTHMNNVEPSWTAFLCYLTRF